LNFEPVREKKQKKVALIL